MAPTDHDRFRFTASDLPDPIGLASKLCYPLDPASERIRGTVDESILKQIATYLASGNSESLKELLVETLNRLLGLPQLYYPETFPDVRLAKLALQSREPRFDSRDALARLNRQILQITYSDDLAPYLEDREGSPDPGGASGNRSVQIMGNATDVVVVNADGATVSVGADAAHALAEFEVKEDDESLSSFVPPHAYDEIAGAMQSRRLIWIIGPPEAGKNTLAKHLAHVQRPFQSIYRIKGTLAWSIMSESTVIDSVVLLTDAVYLTGGAGELDAVAADDEPLDEAELEEGETDASLESEISSTETEVVASADPESERLEDSLHPVKEILDRGNTVLITSTEEVFARASEDPRLLALLEREGCLFYLTADSYGRAERLKLIRNAIGLSHEKGLDGETRLWALRACEKLERESDQTNRNPILKAWLPGEICNFVMSILASAKSQDDIEAELRVPLHNRLYSWFMQLSDESTRSFILTRALFPDLEENELHKKMEEIVNKLKRTYSLTLRPPSIYGYRAAPYISDAPPYRFINAHVLEAATDVVAQYYHQPIGELCELLIRWTMPPDLTSATGTSGPVGGGAKRRRDQLIRESAALRDAVARMVGKVARYDLQSVRELLDSWASHPLGRIGQAAGIALRHTVTSGGNFEQVLHLVEDWAKKSPPETGHFRKRSAADALWRLITVGLIPSQFERALRLLDYLARDSNPYVLRAVAYALSQVAQDHNAGKTKGLIEQLANDHREDVRTHLAICLAAPRRLRNQLEELIEEWARSDNPRLVSVATLYLIGCSRNENRTLLYWIVSERPGDFRKALGIAIRLVLRRRGGSLTLSVLRRLLEDLAGRNDVASNQQAIIAISELKRRAIADRRLDVAASVNGMLKRWEASSNVDLNWVAHACHLNAARTQEEKLALLQVRLDQLALADRTAQPLAVAKGLNLIASQDRLLVHQTLQDWLVAGNANAVASVVFYWLIVTDDAEPERCDYLSAILTSFPSAFERALVQAVEILPPEAITPMLQRLALDERAIVRRQVATVLGSVAAKNENYVFQLLENWLVLDDANAGATVVFFWLAAGDYSEEQRYENLKAVLSSFPATFDRGLREAVRMMGSDCLPVPMARLRNATFHGSSV